MILLLLNKSRYFTFNVLPSRSKWQKWWTWIPSFAIRFSGDVPYFRRQSSGGTRRTWFSLWVSLTLTIKTVTDLPLTTTEQHLRSTGNGSQIPAWKACGTFGRNALAMVRWLSRHNVPFCHSVLDPRWIKLTRLDRCCFVLFVDILLPCYAKHV